MSFRIDWATHEACNYACNRWHYSGKPTSFKSVKFGLWEDGKFQGAVMFGMGANRNIAAPFSMTSMEVCELTRVALGPHRVHVSKVLSICLKMLKKQSPGVRMVISYADTAKGHEGKIYQASNWVYTGSSHSRVFRVHGKLVHRKTLYSKHGADGNSVEWLRANIDITAQCVKSPPKYRYCWGFDADAKRVLEGMRKPYPKCAGSIVSDAPAIHAGEGGAIPTSAL